jgi:riboflavin synthase
MFTGIIEGLGTLSALRPGGRGKQLAIDADFALDGTKPGDSISVNGACLTAVSIAGGRFQVDVSPETLSKTTFGASKIGDRFNLERALRFSDRIDGHLVSGHIDGVGTIARLTPLDNAVIITVEVPETVSRYLIEKGSVAVDGISLTVNKCWETGFEVSIIPHTAKLTTLPKKKLGDAVNIETDMIGKYVERLLLNKKRDSDPGETSSLDLAFLQKTGFL